MIPLTLQQLDMQVLYTLVSIRTPGMTACMRLVTTFGEWYIVIPLAAIAVTILAKQRFRLEATELAYTVLGTTVAVLIIKELVARPRPPQAFRLVQEIGYSFPSWHASMAVAFWGYLSFLAMRQVRHEWGRIILALFCAALALTIGFSRLYLGIHYFSDVIGGFLLGLVALSLSVHFTRRLTKE